MWLRVVFINQKNDTNSKQLIPLELKPVVSYLSVMKRLSSSYFEIDGYFS